MENIRAYTIVHNLGELTDEFYYIPADIIENESTMDFIKEHGFTIFLKTNTSLEVVENFFQQTIYLKNMEVAQLETEAEYQAANQKEEVKENPIVLPELIVKKQQVNTPVDKGSHSGSVQSIISVGVNKLDKLMDLVGEMVIAEAMVTQNSDLDGLELGNFQKAAQQLNKITSELQDIVMSIRMVPIGPTFQKMHRIVRDMCKQLGKEVRLEIRGEDTEVDKNIIEHISDPLMHLVRNSVDHGIENTTERAITGKDRIGTVTLEATNIGSDVQILVRDDGKGLNKDKIIQKVKEQGLLHKKPEEMSDREIFNLIFLPGFSTMEKVLMKGETAGFEHNTIFRSNKNLKKYISATLSPIKDQKNEIIGAVIIIRDITKLKSLEIAHMNERNNFKTIFYFAPIPMVTIDCQSNIAQINDAFLLLLGESKEQLRGKNIIEVFQCVDNDGTSCALFDAIFRSAKKREATANIESKLSFTRKHGKGKKITEQRWFRVSVAPIMDNDNILNQLPSLAWMMDRDFKCNYVNNVWTDFTGRSFEAAMGEGTYQNMHPEDLEKYILMRNEASKYEATCKMEARVKRYDEVYRWCLIVETPYYDLDKKFAGYIGSIYDIQEQKEAEEQIRKEQERYYYLFTY